LGNSRGGFPLPSLRFVITYCDQSFPSPWHCFFPRHPPYLVLPSCPLSRAFPYPQPGDAGGHRSAPAICVCLPFYLFSFRLFLPFRIGPLCFQATCHRRSLNLVFSLLRLFYVIIFLCSCCIVDCIIIDLVIMLA